jgi:hypothetical protein
VLDISPNVKGFPRSVFEHNYFHLAFLAGAEME